MINKIKGNPHFSRLIIHLTLGGVIGKARQGLVVYERRVMLSWLARQSAITHLEVLELRLDWLKVELRLRLSQSMSFRLTSFRLT